MKPKGLQQKTIESFKRITDFLYTLHYQNDYMLEKLRQSNIKSVPGLVKFAFKEMRKQHKARFACSTFNATTPEGDAILGRNFDYMSSPAIVVWTAPQNGYKSVAVDSATYMLYTKDGLKKGLKAWHKNRLLLAPYCPVDGINEKGLAIAVLEIKTKATKQRTGKPTIPTTAAIRTILDTCATVDDAVNYLASVDMCDSLFCNYHYQISDASGASVIVEYVNNEMKVIRNTKESPALCLTNHYVSEGGDNSKGFGYERRSYIMGIQKKHGSILNEREAMQVLRNCHLYYLHKTGFYVTTLWSCIYNVTQKVMTLCAGLNYKMAYQFAADRPGEVISVPWNKADTIEPFDFPHIDKEMALKHTPLFRKEED